MTDQEKLTLIYKYLFNMEHELAKNIKDAEHHCTYSMNYIQDYFEVFKLKAQQNLFERIFRDISAIINGFV